MTRSDAGDFGDVTTLLQDAPDRFEGSYVIVIIEGPNQGERFALDEANPSRTLVGQSAACEIRLTDPKTSRRHAAFEVRGGRLGVTDLDSTNGTFVDGVSVTGAILREGEVIRMGDTSLRVEVSHAPVTPVLSQASAFGRLAGASLAMRRLYPLCERLAMTTVPIVIEGETGTGKEVLAEALHESGPRAAKPFIVFDCTAVPPTLVESELFGHEKGAFTGAVATRKGVFEQADGGTLLIDEIGDLDLALQPKLLRAIERSEVRRVGGNTTTRVDVRVLAATRRDLDYLVQLGRFRDDLFHRLAVARIELPPLRQRWGDVEFLARHFWETLGGKRSELPTSFLASLEGYVWPGNVRELRNRVTRQLALGDLAAMGRSRRESEEHLKAEQVDAPSQPQDSLALVVTRMLADGLSLPVARRQVVDDFERLYLERILAQHGGNTQAAAAASGVARRYFQLLLSRRGR